MKPKKRASIALNGEETKGTVQEQVQAVLATLESHGTKSTREGMARYSIHVSKAFGVPMATMQALAKRVGKNHELALALWDTGWYEARTVAAFVDDPDRVTPAQMDRWCREFDNWAVCDTVCFFLFDRTPHALKKVEQWSRRRGEFAKRAAFALLACVALHGKSLEDELFARCLPLIENAAEDERNFVKKGVSWSLRAIGTRSIELRAAAQEVAQRLSDSTHAAPRWIGKDALRDLAKPMKRRA